MNPISLPHIFTSKEDGFNSAQFVIEPFYPGYGTTVGNALRRVLLSSLEGAAISAVNIKGVPHEFSALPGIKEDFVDIILNLKKVAIKIEPYVAEEGMKLTLSAHGERTVTAGDFQTSTGVTIVNPEFPIMTLTNSGSSIELEASISRGRGFIPVESREKEERELGLIAIDSYFSPIEKVGFTVEDVRVGQDTNYDRIRLDVRTNGAISPLEAIKQSLSILIDQFTSVYSMTEGKRAESSEEGNRESGDEIATLEQGSENVISDASGEEEEKPKVKRGKKKKEE